LAEPGNDLFLTKSLEWREGSAMNLGFERFPSPM
jgi:hypothetical protein